MRLLGLMALPSRKDSSYSITEEKISAWRFAMKKTIRRSGREWIRAALIAALFITQILPPTFAAEFSEKSPAIEAMPSGIGQGAINPSLQEKIGDDSLKTLTPLEIPSALAPLQEKSLPPALRNNTTLSDQLLKKEAPSPESPKNALGNSDNRKDVKVSRKRKASLGKKFASKNPALLQLKEMIAIAKKRKDIPADWVEKMKEENAEASPEVQRLRDAAENLGFNKVALNRKIIADHNTGYTVKIPDGMITDQSQSGRCWIFAGLNAIRSHLLAEKKLPKDFEFSENYIYFFSMLEQSNSYMEKTLRVALAKMAGVNIPDPKFRSLMTPMGKIGDGGWFNWFQFLVSKYGLIPKRAMADTTSSQNSALLGSELQSSLSLYASELMNLMRQKPSLDTAKKAAQIKQNALARTWKILSTHLGTPPAEFDFRQDAKVEKPEEVSKIPATITRYTPQEFSKKIAEFNPEDYVTIANYSRKEKGAVYEVEDSAIGASKPGEPAFNHRFIQTGAERMAELVAASIDEGHPIWFAAQMGRDTDNTTGIMHPQIYDRESIYGFSEAEKKEKISRDDATYLWLRTPNHAMAITGYDRPDEKAPIVKFRVENSWGDEVGTKGIYHMYLDWFKENVYEVIIHRKFLSEKEQTAWVGKAKKITNED